MDDFTSSLEDAYDTVNRWVWGPTPRERVRETQNHIRQVQRDLERERWKLQQRRSERENDLRLRAKKAHCVDDLRNVALDISRLSGALNNLDRMNRMLDGVADKVTSASVGVATSTAMRSVTETMSGIYGAESASAVSQTLRDFERELVRMDVHEDVLQSVTGFENEEEDAELILAKICDEANIQLSFDLPTRAAARPVELPSAPHTAPAVTKRGGGGGSGDQDPPPPPSALGMLGSERVAPPGESGISEELQTRFLALKAL